MRIISLEPFLTDIVQSFGLAESLVGVSHRCEGSKFLESVPKVTRARGRGESGPGTPQLERGICGDFLDRGALLRAAPDLVITRVPGDPEAAPLILSRLRQELADLLGREVAVFSYSPRTLDEVFEAYEQIGKDLGVPDKGKDLVHRQKAQFMDWCDNFYDRMKNKRVTFISGLTPFRLAGYWIPGMIRLASCQSQAPAAGQEAKDLVWQDIVDWKPDVLIVAPKGVPLHEAVKRFKELEKLPGWEDLPAVKRGEVYFADGLPHFYRPGPALVESMGILVSAIAGFESGYITPRESFYKLRWLEVQRHRF